MVQQTSLTLNMSQAGCLEPRCNLTVHDRLASGLTLILA